MGMRYCKGNKYGTRGFSKDANKFYKLVEDGKEELYPGCKSFLKLSSIVTLLQYKNLHGLSNVAFDDLLQLLKKMFPEAKLPASFTKAKKVIKDLGLDYKKIPACPNDCMLYWKEYKDAEVCHICHTSKWKQQDIEKQQNKNNIEHSKTCSKVPAKVVWHFPLKPRLESLFMCTAKHMTWHDEGRPKDGNLRHPADGQSWKEFDSLYPHFAKETRNVRLGLSSDGFNPFGTMSITHRTWPVVLINYNLPSWMSLKLEYFMLSLLIPRPESTGNNIDIYLQPFVEELKDLWVNGLETYDKSKDETFKLYAALIWTISDFPGYSMLSGWKTKENFACPSCNHETSSLYLKHSKKTCYMDHRRFLDGENPWRLNKNAFNGKTESRLSLKPLSGVEALSDLFGFNNLFEITETLCEFEKIFVPAFFDIMVHLPIHLVNEVRLGGPVQYRWMFFMERYLCKLKSYVRNKSRPEGSIAEGYLIEECLNFCSRYMQGDNETPNNGADDTDDLMKEGAT
ncbi:uncharacterized protein LOC143548848 [Bidens hawaiensis]|uniref:uncharacterized protein LOC143548848 n=1 Tax=Bidens hawaiensis TaxID=980011 RepID=UPI004049D970